MSDIGIVISSRAVQFSRFSGRVVEHIENYTVPQYGDAPDDNVESWTAEDCVRQIEKYAKRFGKNSRPGQDALDLIKVAHYACLAHDKL